MTKTSTQRIIAMGGGGFSMEPDNPLLDQFILRTSGITKPKICFIPTASGDSDNLTLRFYQAFSQYECEPTFLGLFNRTIKDLETFLLDQDIIYVGGGNTANMLAIWRAHGVDKILHRAWQKGILLCGLSAGSICWFDSGITDSYGRDELFGLQNCLGVLAGSHCPHYDGEALRRPTYHRLIQNGTLANGLAIDDGAAVLFHGNDIITAVSSRPKSRAYSVFQKDGKIVEEEIPTRFLG